MVSVPSLEHYDFLFPCNGINCIEMLTICQILAQETEKIPVSYLDTFKSFFYFRFRLFLTPVVIKDRDYLMRGYVFLLPKHHITDCPFQTLELADFPLASCTALSCSLMAWSAGANFEKEMLEVLVGLTML